MLNKILNDFEVSVEAGGSKRGRVGLGRRVDVRAALRQQLHDLQVAGSSCAPERRCALYRLTVECD